MPTSKVGPVTILVTDAGRNSALSVIRSLGRKGWRVVAADADPRSIGFRSRYVAGRVVYPPPETSPQRTVDTLYEAAVAHKVDLIIPVTDAVILPLSQRRTEFASICRLALPETSALEVVTNKLKTIELAQKLDVPAPRTILVHSSAEACEAAQGLDWPVVLKPQVSRLYRDQAPMEAFTVSYAKDLDSLAGQMQHFEGRCPVLLQEYTPGSGQGVELLVDRGRALAAFQHHRLREVPVHGGASAFRESVPVDPLLLDYSTRLLSALDWTGLAMVEFKTGRRGPKLMEINGRVWGSLPLAVSSGMDFPARLVELILSGSSGSSAPLDCSYRLGVRSRNLELEILWIATTLRGKKRYPYLAAPGRLQGVKALLELLHPAYKFDNQIVEDPSPGLAEIPRIARKLGRKIKEAA